MFVIFSSSWLSVIEVYFSHFSDIFYTCYFHLLFTFHYVLCDFSLCFSSNLYGQFYYLKIVLSYLIASIRFHIPFFISFWNTHSGEDKLRVYWEDDYRRTIHNEGQEKNGYLQDLRFPYPRSLDGLSLSSRCLLCPSYPKLTSSLLLITWWFP